MISTMTEDRRNKTRKTSINERKTPIFDSTLVVLLMRFRLEVLLRVMECVCSILPLPKVRDISAEVLEL